LLFVNGERYEVSQSFAENICAEDELDFRQLQSVMSMTDKEVLLNLFNNGAVIAR
jgi:hypothetical protein